MCCMHCHAFRLDHVTPDNKHLWSEDGFCGPDGCRLDRADRPTQCNEWDCKDYLWFVAKIWRSGQWLEKSLGPIPMSVAMSGSAGVSFAIHRSKDGKNFYFRSEMRGKHEENTDPVSQPSKG